MKEIHSIHFPSIHSTNTWAKSNSHMLPKNALTVISADIQTAGRGRFDHKWESFAGNLFSTYCFFQKERRDDIGNLPQLLALSAVDAIGEIASIKWPNDLIIEEHKIGGILAETLIIDDMLLIALGIGINVCMNAEMLKKVGCPATSLHLYGDYHKEQLSSNITSTFSKKLTLFLKEGFSSFFPLFQKKCNYKLGQWIRFSSRGQIREGIFDGINERGELLLRLSSGKHEILCAGEIFFGNK